jgi:mannosyltransferase
VSGTVAAGCPPSHSLRATPPAGTRLVAIAIVLSAALHVALAAPGLSDSAWLDEIVTIQLCRLPLSLTTAATNDATPPVYYLLVHGWGELFGCDATGLRILSLLLSALSCAALLALGSVWFNFQTGLVAALLFAVSALQIRYATEARCYMLVELLLLTSYWLFFALRESPRRRTAVALAIVNAALVQTHYVAAFGLVPQLADVVLFRLFDRSFRAHYVRSQLLAVTLCLPWAAFVAAHWPPITPSWVVLPDAEVLDYNFRMLLATPLQPLWYAVALAAILLSTVVRSPARLGHRALERLVILASWGVGAPLIAYAVSGSLSVVLPRYLLFASLGLWLAIAYVVSLAPVQRWRRALLLALLGGPTLVGSSDPAISRPDWEGAMAIVRDNLTPSRTQLVVPDWDAITVAYYLLDDPGVDALWDVAGALSPLGVHVSRDPDGVIWRLSEQVDTVILITDPSHELAVVLSMPQMCFFRERFRAQPNQLVVRVLDRSCEIG